LARAPQDEENRSEQIKRPLRGLHVRIAEIQDETHVSCRASGPSVEARIGCSRLERAAGGRGV